MTGLCERCLENEAAINDYWCPDCILEVELAMAEVEEQVKPDFRWQPLGTNGSYTLEDIQVRVAEYEDEYGLPSDALLEMHRDDRAPTNIPNFDRHVWLSLYRSILEKQP
jgi:hypothetical protein